MISEKMLEYLVLDKIIKKYLKAYSENYLPEIYNWNKIFDRYTQLKDEFLEPYVIDSNSKE
jgi:hypothetical protein